VLQKGLIVCTIAGLLSGMAVLFKRRTLS
jgi:hypothetical protein